MSEVVVPIAIASDPVN